MNDLGKQALRKEAMRIINALGSEASASDGAIIERLCGLSEFLAAKTVFCFIGTDWEIDTMPIIGRAITLGKRVCAPKCGSKGIMNAYEIKGAKNLCPGVFGIPEPAEYCAPVCPGEIDFSVVPCVACDRNGNRLGRGGGYYDRYLAKRGFTAAAICREALLFDEIPAEAHDAYVDAVVTEKGVYRRGL